MEEITMYCTSWCVDCRRAKKFLTERGVAFSEINIDEEPDAEDLVMQVNEGCRKVPTIKIGERYYREIKFQYVKPGHWQVNYQD